MPELRFAAYLGLWMFLTQMGLAAHPEAKLEAPFVMFAGILFMAVSIEGMLYRPEPPTKEQIRQRQYEGDMMELFGIDVRQNDGPRI